MGRKSAQYDMGREVILVERVGRTNEYAVIRADGSVHEHKTHSEDKATLIAVRLSRREEQ